MQGDTPLLQWTSLYQTLPYYIIPSNEETRNSDRAHSLWFCCWWLTMLERSCVTVLFYWQHSQLVAKKVACSDLWHDRNQPSVSGAALCRRPYISMCILWSQHCGCATMVMSCVTSWKLKWRYILLYVLNIYNIENVLKIYNSWHEHLLLCTILWYEGFWVQHISQDSSLGSSMKHCACIALHCTLSYPFPRHHIGMVLMH
jgi:hypothetical protein